DIDIEDNTFAGTSYAIRTSIGDFGGYEVPANKHIWVDHNVYQHPPSIIWVGKVYQGLGALRPALRPRPPRKATASPGTPVTIPQAAARMNAGDAATDIAHVGGTEHAAGTAASYADSSWFDAHHDSVA